MIVVSFSQVSRSRRAGSKDVGARAGGRGRAFAAIRDLCLIPFCLELR